jgi:tetratricopeptide (TPR) repeat protein
VRPHALALTLAFPLLAACARGRPAETPRSSVVRHELELAEAAEARRQHDVARIHYERAIASAPDPRGGAYARREFAETLATWGENSEARQHLEAAVRAVPGDAIAWQMLGILRHRLGDIPGAFHALERSKHLAPRAWIPRRDLAVLHWSRGEGRTADPDPSVAAKHRASALAEYKGMLELELPERLRDKVRWAIDVLSGAPPATAPVPLD